MSVIKFSNVGRYLRSWETKMEPVTPEKIINQVKSVGGLLSRGVEVDFNEDAKSGTIWVGGVRPVGNFEIVEEVENEAAA